MRGFDLQTRERVFGFVAALTFGILERFTCPGECFAYFVDVTFGDFFDFFLLVSKGRGKNVFQNEILIF